MRFDIWQAKRECEENKHHFDKNGNLAVNVWLDFIDFKPVVAMFVGKALKPKYYYRFQNEMDAARFIKTRVEYELNNINDRIDRKAAERDLKKNYKTSLKVGDILHGSWGYDMTINEFYQITEIKNKTITLREVRMQRKAAGMYEDVRPEANCFMTANLMNTLNLVKFAI